MKKFCSKCGNEILEDEKFCGKCGQKIEANIESTKKQEDKVEEMETNQTLKDDEVISETEVKFKKNRMINKDIISEKIRSIKIKKIVPLIFIIIVVLILFGYKSTSITDKYIEKYLCEENGFNQFDDLDVKILARENIKYKDFNQLLLYRLNTSYSGQSVSLVGILLVNKNKDIIDGFTTNTNFNYVIDSCNTSSSQKVVKICAKYLQEKGEEIFNASGSDELKNLIKDISNEIGVEQARNHVDVCMKRDSNSSTDYTVLFEKNSAYVSYIAFYETGLKYNSSYPYDEKTYNAFLQGYDKKSTRDMLEYLYGPAYTTINEYSLYEIKENSNEIGRYDSLDTIRKKFNVD